MALYAPPTPRAQRQRAAHTRETTERKAAAAGSLAEGEEEVVDFGSVD